MGPTGVVRSVNALVRAVFRRPWGPGEKVLAVLVVLAVAAGATVLATVPDWGEDECPRGIQRVEGRCMAVADGDFDYDGGLRGLIEDVADENDDAQDHQYRSVALTMPFSSDDSSAMPPDLIKHALAGALAAQRAVNEGTKPKVRLLLADLGRDMKQWRPVVETLDGLPDSERLIAAVGLPSSTKDSKDAIKALAEKRIPSVGPVITSSDMNADGWFFKTSPSNAQFTKALRRYLDEHEGAKNGSLIVDKRSTDTYSRDLEKEVSEKFGEEFDLKRNYSEFLGTRGDEEGTPLLFDDAVDRVCKEKVDTVFYAGRDEDLYGLVDLLAGNRDCGYRKPLRVMKVGIGLPPKLMGENIERRMRKADIQLVQAVSVDPTWSDDSVERPVGYEKFDSEFGSVEKEHDLGSKPRHDGYAVMYYDALQAVVKASDRVYTDSAKGKTAGESTSMAFARDSVRNELRKLNPYNKDEDGCTHCVQGASGSYGFVASFEDLWPVCKGVHVLEYPGRGVKGRPTRDAKSSYRTDGGSCPKGL